MRAREVAGTLSGEVRNAMPEEIRGWPAVGIAEITSDTGAHQAWGLILQEPCKWCQLIGAPCASCKTVPPIRLALWWQREPDRRWRLTPLTVTG